MSYITREEAAYLMGLSVDTVNKMVEDGTILVKRIGSRIGMIHESEMHKFQHPWLHITRLDQRINAQQALVETLKGKVNEGAWEKCQREINDAQYTLSVLGNRVLEIEQKLKPIFDMMPALVETINGLVAESKPKQKTVKKRVTKKK